MNMEKERRRICQVLVGLFTFVLTLPFLPFRLFGEPKDSIQKTNSSRNPPKPRGNGKSTIVIMKSPRIKTREGKINRDVLREMVDEGIKRDTGQYTASNAWKSLFRCDDKIGIKVNCLGGKMLSSHVELVEVIVEGLESASIPKGNIIIWDRLTRELQRAGFQINTSNRGVQCFGTDAVGYDSELQIQGSIGSCFSQIISTHCSALINVPVLKDHDLSGVSVSMKNFYGAIHNPNKYHDNSCDPYIADLNSHIYIKDKLRLIICDGITAVYNGGPAYKARWAWNYNGLIISQDPVALDAMGRQIIEEKRREMGLKTLKEAKREPTYIASAARLGLGIDDLKKARIIQINI